MLGEVPIPSQQKMEGDRSTCILFSCVWIKTSLIIRWLRWRGIRRRHQGRNGGDGGGNRRRRRGERRGPCGGGQFAEERVEAVLRHVRRGRPSAVVVVGRTHGLPRLEVDTTAAAVQLVLLLGLHQLGGLGVRNVLLLLPLGAPVLKPYLNLGEHRNGLSLRLRFCFVSSKIWTKAS